MAVEAQIEGSVDTAQGIAQAISEDLFRNLYKNAATPIGKAIMDSGVADVNDTQAMAAMIRAGCIGAHKAILEEAEKLGHQRAGKEAPRARN